MTGPVDWNTLGWVLTAIGGCLTGAFAIWFFIDRSIKGAVSSMRDDIKAQMHDLGVQLGAAASLASMADKAVAELRAHIAEKYVTKDAMDQILAGNREIRESVGGVHQRLDRVFEMLVEK